jgi:hypothetical protein
MKKNQALSVEIHNPDNAVGKEFPYKDPHSLIRNYHTVLNSKKDSFSSDQEKISPTCPSMEKLFPFFGKFFPRN